MSNIRLELNDKEAELLYQALITVISASRPELMRQRGWDGVDEVTATTLIQSIFDNKDIEILNNIAMVMASQVVAPVWDYSAYDIQDPDTSLWDELLQDDYPDDQVSTMHDVDSDLTPNKCSNIVSLTAFRNRKKGYQP
jgi:hypothetical protein